MKKMLYICLFGMMLSGCEKPQTLDGSNVESLRSSIVEMRSSLTIEEQERFDKAIELAMFNDIDFNDLVVAGRNKNGDILTQKMCKSLDGKTAEEIFLQAENLKHKHVY